MEYLDLERLSDEDELLRRNVHRLAEEVLRPISIKLDRMSPRDRIRPNSPIFEAIREMKKMGLHRIHLPRDRGGVGLTNLQRYTIDEELGWGGCSCFGFRDYLWRLLSLVMGRQAYNPNPSTLTVPLGFQDP